MEKQRASIEIRVEAGAVVEVILNRGARAGLESNRGDKKRKRPRTRAPISDTTDPRTGQPYAGPIFAPDLSTGLPEFPSAQDALEHLNRHVGTDALPLQLGSPKAIKTSGMGNADQHIPVYGSGGKYVATIFRNHRGAETYYTWNRGRH